MNKPILFVNACVREESRTRRLAKLLLTKLARPYEEVRLSEVSFPVADAEFLRLRDTLIAKRDFGNALFDLARQFSEAETIVIAAPYWDLSFPAAFKQYIEQINVVGITFSYSEEGVPIGLCRADRIYYVTTAGGCFAPEEYGYGYVKALAQNYYGIHDVRKIEAAGLDLSGADAGKIMREAEASISAHLARPMNSQKSSGE